MVKTTKKQENGKLAVRFVLFTTVRARDVHGNCYHVTTITSTKTGKMLHIRSSYGSDGCNELHTLREALGEDSRGCYLSYEQTVKARDYDRYYRQKIDSIWDHELTEEKILSLESF